MNDFGIADFSYQELQKYFKANAKIRKVVIFGSRATGTYRNGSDIDFAIWGDDISVTAVKVTLDDLQTPYMYDVVVYDELEKVELKQHILTKGKIFYEKKE